MKSDLERVRRELTRNEKFLRCVIDTDPNFIFIKNREGQFILANQAVADVYGTSTEEIIGKTDLDFNPQKDEVQHFISDDVRVIDSGEELVIDAERITDAQGNVRWLKTVKRPIQFTRNGPVYALGVSTDITAARNLQEKLGQSQKMKALGQLAGGIAHDFNNSLTAILGLVDLILIDPSTKNAIKNAEKIGRAAEHARDLTAKLLGFARQGKNTHSIVDLNVCVRETVSLIRRLIDESIRIEEDLDPQPILVRGDGAQLQQVVMNLAINSRDALQGTASGDKVLRFATRVRANDKVELFVADTGRGIPLDVLPRIYEPFFSTKGEGGTGLGLSMVYGTVRNHGGEISVESTVGVGTSFRVVLPRAQGSILENKRTGELPRQGSGRILVVDDNAEVLNATAEMLQVLGYEVVRSASAEEAIEILKGANNEIDLLLTDLVMPDMHGGDCAKWVKENYPHIKIVLSTGYGKNNEVQQALDSGVDAFMNKPYRLEQLSRVIAELLFANHDQISQPRALANL